MNALKQLCVVVVLSAVGYGAYRTLTGKQDGDAPPEAAGWETGPQVQFPDHLATSTAAPAAMPPLQAATTSAAPPTPLAAAPDASAAPLSSYPTTMPSSPAAAPAAAPTPLEAAPARPLTTSDDAAPPAATAAAAAPTTAPAGPQATLTAAGIDVTSATPPDARAEFPAAMASAQKLLDANKLAEALQALSEWYYNPALTPEQRHRLQDLLDRLAGTVVYSTQHLLEPPYVVQPGDTLETIGQRYGVSWQLLAKINGLAGPEAVRPGEQLKVVRGPFDAVVTVQNFELTLFLRGRYAGRFTVGIGQDLTTPAGEFEVRAKTLNPAYAPPGQQPIAAGDPANPLGERWIDLGSQIGIHGARDPQSIGRGDGPGYIRLGGADFDDVYDILSVGSRVVLHR